MFAINLSLLVESFWGVKTHIKIIQFTGKLSQQKNTPN